MATDKIKRSEAAYFVNIGSSGSAVYARLGTGVTTSKVNMNPKTTEEQYIHEDVATTTLDAYAPTLPVEMTAYADDSVFAFVKALYNAEAVGSDANTDIVEVDLYASSSASKWPARKHSVSVQIDDYGGDAGAPAKINFTFNYMGAQTPGSFNPTSLTFTS